MSDELIAEILDENPKIDSKSTTKRKRKNSENKNETPAKKKKRKSNNNNNSEIVRITNDDNIENEEGKVEEKNKRFILFLGILISLCCN